MGLYSGHTNFTDGASRLEGPKALGLGAAYEREPWLVGIGVHVST